MTAKEFLIEKAYDISFKDGQLISAEITPEMLIEFAKLHVNAALIEVGNKIIGPGASSVRDIYPLENIK